MEKKNCCKIYFCVSEIIAERKTLPKISGRERKREREINFIFFGDGRKFILFKPWIIISGIEVIGNQERERENETKIRHKDLSTLTQTNHINQKINWRCLECDKVESSFHLLECIIWHQQWHALDYEHFSSRLCLQRIKFYIRLC